MAGRWAIFGGVLLIVVGAFSALDGLAAIINNDIFVKVNKYAFKLDVTAWGWIHLLLGLALVAIGWGVLTGAFWARLAGIVVTSISAIAAFLSLPYYPLWESLIIGLNAIVIWALANWEPPAKA
jgi:hypothetical protein